MALKGMLCDCWGGIQDDLFLWLKEELGPLSDMHKQIIPCWNWRVWRCL